MMKGEAARKKHSSVRAWHGARSMVGSAKSPELCQHRDTSTRARDGLPCLQEHHSQYSSKEELANKKGRSKSGFKQFSFSLFPREALISPAQLPHCLALPQKCPAKSLHCPQHHLHNSLYCPQSGEEAVWSLGVAMAKSRTRSRKSRVAHCSLPVASLGQTRGFLALDCGEATFPQPWGIPCCWAVPTTNTQLAGRCPPAWPHRGFFLSPRFVFHVRCSARGSGGHSLLREEAQSLAMGMGGNGGKTVTGHPVSASAPHPQSTKHPPVPPERSDRCPLLERGWWHLHPPGQSGQGGAALAPHGQHLHEVAVGGGIGLLFCSP